MPDLAQVTTRTAPTSAWWFWAILAIIAVAAIWWFTAENRRRVGTPGFPRRGEGERQNKEGEKEGS